MPVKGTLSALAYQGTITLLPLLHPEGTLIDLLQTVTFDPSPFSTTRMFLPKQVILSAWPGMLGERCPNLDFS